MAAICIVHVLRDGRVFYVIPSTNRVQVAENVIMGNVSSGLKTSMEMNNSFANVNKDTQASIVKRKLKSRIDIMTPKIRCFAVMGIV